MLDVASEIARAEPPTLAKIAARVRGLYPDAPSFSVDRLFDGLRARKISFKRTRLSLEKRYEPAFQQEKSRLAGLRDAVKADKTALSPHAFATRSVMNGFIAKSPEIKPREISSIAIYVKAIAATVKAFTVSVHIFWRRVQLMSGLRWLIVMNGSVTGRR